jgi:site-specific DNA-methyltransferase (adenine-specific)
MRVRKEVLAEGVELYLGDCREILPTLGKVDAVVTDPPYGIGLEYGIFDDTEENVRALVGVFVPWAIQNAQRTLITSGNQCQHLYPRPKWTLAWVTPAGAGSGPWGFSCWQPILAYGSCPYLASGKGRRSDIFVHTETSEKNGHPCPKPINFMNKLVERASLVGQTILDPFLGSGTTGISSVRQGRKFIGIEIEPKYFDIACKRIQAALDAPDMFVEPPKPAKQEALEL